MSTSSDNFCDFVPAASSTYQCSKCGTTIYMEDFDINNQPKLLCKNLLARSARDTDASFSDKIFNFANAVVSHVSSGMPRCTQEQIIKRHDICKTCEFFKDDTCGKCGCPLTRNQQFVSKLAWADQECPIGKWGKEV